MRRQQFARACRATLVQTAADSRPPTRTRSSLRPAAGLALAALTIAAVGCSRTVRPLVRPDEPPGTIQQLWQDLASPRDLFSGPGGADGSPSERTFEFVARDISGWSPGFDVRDRNGLQWSVKLGPEAQSEASPHEFSGASDSISHPPTT